MVVHSPAEAPRLKAFRLSDPPSEIFTRELSEIGTGYVNDLTWNPDGSVLAICAFMSGLFFSYDGGMTFVQSDLHTTGLFHTLRLVWMNGQVLYVDDESIDGGRILEMAIHNGQATITRTVVSGKDIRLWGVLDGDVIYSLKNRVYRGDKLFYESDQRMGGMFADDGHAAFLKAGPSMNQIFVLDKQANVMSRRGVPADTVLIGLSSAKNSLYLLKDRRIVQVCGLADNDGVSTIWGLGR